MKKIDLTKKILVRLGKKIKNSMICVTYQIKKFKYSLIIILVTILLLTVRIKGWIQPLEWMALDYYFKIAPIETIDEKIVIIGINEADYRKLEPYYPIDDGVLANLLLKIEQQSPMVIGLDLYRDLEVSPQCNSKIVKKRFKEIKSEFDCQSSSEQLNKIFTTTGNLIGIQRLNSDPQEEVRGNQALVEEGRAFANNLIVDPDGVLRRGLLQTNIGDKSLYNFAYILAHSYLVFSGIEDTTNEKNLSFNKKVIPKFKANDGSYIRAEDGGYQTLINWRSPPNGWKKVSLFDVLKERVPSDLFTDKVVIIGSMLNSSVDAFLVPHNRGLFYAPNHLYGVEVQANITSQIISAVLEKRPLVKVLPDWEEYLIIALAIIATVSGAKWWNKKCDRNCALNLTSLIAIIIGMAIVCTIITIAGSYQLFVWQRLWLPIVPIVLGITFSTVTSITVIFGYRAREYQKNLELTNYRLHQLNHNLEQSNANLKQFLEALPVGVLISDNRGNPYYTNQKAQQILGDALCQIETAAQLKKNYPLYQQERACKADRSPIFRALQGEEIQSSEYTLKITSQNQLLPLEISARPVYDDLQEIIYAIAVFQDISDRKKAQAQLKSKNLELENTQAQLVAINQNLDRLVRDRTQQLEQTVAMLKATQDKLVFENSLLKDTSFQSYQYQIGGTLPLSSPTYVVRVADRLLYKALKENQLCCIFNSRQMGKSSLRVKMMKQLEREDYTCVAIDLTMIGNKNINVEKWYGSFVYKLAANLNLTHQFNFRTWWSNYDFLSPVEKLRLFIDEILLEKIPEKIIIFIDEIDSVLGLDFAMDDFFALIRSCYNYRAEIEKYQRLNFVLLGVATPYKLIKDHNLTPFNIGISIPLSGFALHEAAPLIAGFKHIEANGTALVEKVLSWTGGQPFLTQKICYLIVESNPNIAPGHEEEFVTRLIETKVINNWQVNDDPEHLKTIANRLLQNDLSTKMLQLYEQILIDKEMTIAFHESLEMQELILSGLIMVENGKAKLFNRIYETVFNRDWVTKNLNQSRSIK